MNATGTPADRFDVFLCSAAADPAEKALRAGGLRVFRGSPFDDFDMIAAARVLLSDSPCPPTARVLTIIPGESLPDLVARVRDAAASGPGPALLRTVHNELSARRSVLVRGLAGTGKTTLAEQYAGLVAGSGGRVLRTGPFGHLAPDEFLPQFHLALATAAGASGLGFERLTARMAEAGTPALLLVDDVPAGLPPAVLDRVVLPMPTLLTSRSARWTGATVDLPGLTPGEARLLGVPDAGFVSRCDGHPMTLRAAGFLLRERPGTSPDDLPDTAPQAIRDVLLRLDGPARELLRLGGVLAPAPIPPEIASFGAAAEELVARGFATWVDGNLRLQALAVEVACGEFGEPAAERAAEAVLEGLADASADDRPAQQTHAADGDGSAGRLPHARAAEAAALPPQPPQVTAGGDRVPPSALTPQPPQVTAGGHRLPPSALTPQPPQVTAGGHRLPPSALTRAAGSGEHPAPANPADERRRLLLLQHARVLAELCPARRVALLRPLAAAHEAHGDPATAGEIHAAILSTGEATCADFTAAARVELACGLDVEAAGHARQALALAEDAAEAALVAAQALDSQGDYAEADRTFWHAHHPVTGEERCRAAQARRLRGRPREAIALLEPALGDPGAIRDELHLEYARNLFQSGQPKRARDVAAGIDHCPDADLIRADAALAEHDPAELEKSYADQYGVESPLTLTAAVHAGRALLALGQPRQALEKLAETDRVVRRVLGDDHRLHHRISHARGLAHARLREFDRQADLLEPLRKPQIRQLGRTHPETLETHLDLGLALALGGRGPLARATKLVDDAARDAESVSPGLAAKARAAKQVVRLPEPFVSALHALERVVWP